MIKSTKAYKLLSGIRGEKPLDIGICDQMSAENITTCFRVPRSLGDRHQPTASIWKGMQGG